jgi:hypothetical protein
VELRRYLFLISLAIAAILVIVVWLYPSGNDFMSANPSWNGAGEFTDSFVTSSLRYYADLPEDPDNTILVLIPYTELTNAELALLDGYISDGGTLVLADDYGYGNTILEHMHINASFNGETLLDPVFNYKNSFFPRVTDFSASALTGDLDSIILNHATAMTIGDGVSTIAQSSAASFIDSNGNQLYDEGEPAGPLTVAAQANLSDGIVILLSDPSIIINCMQDMDDNLIFITNIMRIKGADAQIMLDESHLPGANLDEAKSVLASIRDALATPAGTAAIVTAIVVLILLPTWIRRKGGKHGS